MSLSKYGTWDRESIWREKQFSFELIDSGSFARQREKMEDRTDLKLAKFNFPLHILSVNFFGRMTSRLRYRSIDRHEEEDEMIRRRDWIGLKGVAANRMVSTAWLSFSLLF